jgi:hypothetical protein
MAHGKVKNFPIINKDAGLAQPCPRDIFMAMCDFTCADGKLFRVFMN